jgi:hypothetical protein
MFRISDFRKQPKYCVACSKAVKAGQYVAYRGYAVCSDNQVCLAWIAAN